MSTVRPLPIQDLSPDSFEPFGTVVGPMDDGVPFGPHDAELVLGEGTPRFYTMRIPGRGFDVDAITRHRHVTQVLASANGDEWFMAVAPPAELENDQASPELDEIKAFRIPGGTAVMLSVGTWHAGPLFEGADQTFFNLELSDTNVTDHHTCRLDETYDTILRLERRLLEL